MNAIKNFVYDFHSQVDLLKELLNLQKDMVIMMLSMLEGMSFRLSYEIQILLAYKLHAYYGTKIHFLITGNVVNGTIGKQMVDTLVESASNVEVRYFCLISIMYS